MTDPSDDPDNAVADESHLGELDEGDLTTDSGSGASVEAGQSTESPVWTLLDWKICLGLIVGALLVVGLHVRSYPTLSPIDELQHVDYMIRASSFDVPRTNEKVEFEAMSEAACRSVDAPGYVGPPCGLPTYDPNDFQELGFNTAASQMPPYYFVTGVAARSITVTGIVGSKVTAARMVGGVWLGAALCVMWYVMATLELRRRARLVPIIALLATPLIVFHHATVNPDSSLLLAGSVMLLATLKYEAGRLKPWWLAVIGIGLMVVESTNLLIVAACSVYLMVRTLPRRDLSPALRAVPLALFGVFVFVRLNVFDRVQDALYPAVKRTGPRAPMFERNRTSVVSFDKVLAQLDSNFTPIGRTYIPPQIRSQTTIAFIQVTNWFFIAALVAAALFVAVPNKVAWLTRVGVVSLLAAGPFYTFYYAYFSNADYPAPGRFGLPLLPLVVVATASVLENRRAWWTGAAIAGASMASMVVQLIA